MLDANAVLRYVLNDNEKDVLKLGLETYAENNLDFVDCILYAYKSLKNYDVLTLTCSILVITLATVALTLLFKI